MRSRTPGALHALAISICILSRAVEAQSFVINEVMSSNGVTLLDDAGESSDWVEILNVGPSEIQLEGYGLSDNAAPLQWVFPNLLLPPGGRRVVFCSGREPSAVSGLHASFKIAAEGEGITLASPDGAIIDSVDTGFLPLDVSIGRFPDGTGTFSFHSPATPGAPNASPGYASIGGRVTFSRAGGFHPGPVTVSLSRDDPAGTIFVTTDGSIPTEASPVYTGPIQLTSTTVVRARVLGPGLFPGETATHTFIIGRTSTLPVVSISTDPANFFDEEIGIHVTGSTYDPSFPYFGANFWEDWERPVHLELYEPDGTLGFSADAGAQIFGGWSRGNPQRSLAFFARGQYGPGKFDYRILPEKTIDSFESFVLRNSGNDWQITHFRDAMMTSLVKDLGIDRAAYRPSVVFINGEYWGILNLREKINEHFLAANHPGVSPDQIDLLEANGSAIHGDANHYNAVLALLRQDVADPSVYGQVEAMVDVGNFIDYQAAQIYFDNTDWPGNNIKFWRPRVEGGRWKWILYDTDFGFGIWNAGNYVNNTLAFALEPNGPGWPNPPWSTFVLRRLITNRVFVEDFVNRFMTHLNAAFSPARVIARIDEMAAALEPEMQAQRSRWGSSVSAWRSSVQVLRDFANRRIPQVRSHLAGRFGLGAQGLLGITVASPGGGIVEVQGVPIREYPFNGTYFQSLPIRLVARPDPGYRFAGWIGMEPGADPVATVTVSSSVLAVSATFELDCAVAGDVVINEIQYNAPDDADPGDWVELHNPTGVDIDVSGWTLRDSDAGHGFTIPGVTLPGDGGYLVLCSDSAAFSSLHPATTGYVGDLGFSLSGSGETISLFDASGRLVDVVAYGDSAPWPEEADGGGATLALKNPSLDNFQALHWAASGGGGTPGAQNDVFVPIEVECGAGEASFVRGDCNADGVVTISDPVRLLLANFAGASVPCWSACDADADGSTGGVTDAIYLLGYLFALGPPPAPPFPGCGVSLSASDLALGCATAPIGCR